MKVICNLTRSKNRFRNPVLAIGVFDGLHVGHQALLSQVIAKAKEINGTPMVMTFDPHPIKVLHPEVNLPLIISLEQRLELFKEFGMKAAVVIEFTKKFSKLPPASFIKKYIVEAINPKIIFVGDDFRFGQNRAGSVDIFQHYGQKYGFKVEAVQPVAGEIGKISSTQIRHYILEGNLAKAKRFLGRPVTLLGKVVTGDRRGKTLGFPTANLKPGISLIPPKGVYAVKVKIGKKIYEGMTNVGQRPSFTPLDEHIIVETHLFNFRQNLYGKNIAVSFIKKIRNEKFFHSPQALVLQLKKDAIKSRRILHSA